MYRPMLIRLADMLVPRICLLCRTPFCRLPVCRHCALPPVRGLQSCCSICQNVTLEPGPCAACRSTPPPWDALRHLWSYADNVQAAITVMKYRPSLGACRVLTSAFIRALPGLVDLSSIDAV